MKRQLKSPRKFDSKNSILLVSLLTGMLIKRKSYSFQLFKQFFLFPDESQSSQRTVSKYDQLIFSDEQLHTMVKKLQTKLIENKIWAFLNIRALPYLKAAKKMERPIKRLKKRIEQQSISFTFAIIKTYAFSKIVKSVRSPSKISSYTHIKITQTEVKEELYRVGNHRSNHFLNDSSSSNRRLEGSRSRSGSITRFQYDIQNGKRLLLNGEIIPCRINIKRSESPLKQPEYIKITKSPDSNSEDIRYIGLSRADLQKRDNLNLQYARANANRRPQKQKRSDSKSRIIYVQSSINNENHSIICPHCTKPHSGNECSGQKSQKKITRLRSTSRKQLPSDGYLQHLNS